MEADLADIDVAVARTLPGQYGRKEVREVEALYLDMIAAARRCIYIENQYFTASAIGDALARRLAEPGGPEIVFVLRLLSHGWLEEHTMHVLRTRLIQRLRRADRHGRLQIYYAHIDGLREGTCIDIHSKLMIVDDEILRVGSANLCNRSMGLDSECDLALEARRDAAAAAAIRAFRARLLGEHLDVPAARVEAEIARLGSVNAAIAALSGRPRTLRPLANVPEWPDAVLELAGIADPERAVNLDRLVEELAPGGGDPPPPALRRTFAKLASIGLALLALTALWRSTPLADYLDPQLIVAAAREFGGRPWAPLLVLGAYTPACLLLFPRPLITLGAVVAFGPVRGSLCALAGILLAALVTYGLGRRLPRRLVRRLSGRRLNQVTRTLRRRGLMAMTAVRLVPLAPFAVIGLVAGAVHIRLSHFMLGTLFGTLPGTFAATVFGRQIEAALQDPGGISYGLLAAIAGVLAVLTLAVRRWLGAQSRKVEKHARSGNRTR